jgi:hypothetical protein
MHLVFEFTPEIDAQATLKLKVEINSREHASLLGVRRHPFAVGNDWCRGTAEIASFEPEQLFRRRRTCSADVGNRSRVPIGRTSLTGRFQSSDFQEGGHANDRSQGVQPSSADGRSKQPMLQIGGSIAGARRAGHSANWQPCQNVNEGTSAGHDAGHGLERRRDLAALTYHIIPAPGP